jgi:hypothetical protein
MAPALQPLLLIRLLLLLWMHVASHCLHCGLLLHVLKMPR